MSGLDVDELRLRLKADDIAYLFVTASRRHPGDLTVYLHSNAGRPNQQEAMQCIAAMPEVARVEASAQSWAILSVYLAAHDQARPAQAPRD